MKIKDTLASIIYRVFSRDKEEHPVPREQWEKLHTVPCAVHAATSKTDKIGKISKTNKISKNKGEDSNE